MIKYISSDDFVDKLRSQADIVNIVSEYVTLTKKGRNYWGCCPFHQEKTPSFSVAPDKGFFYCFGCQAGGDAFRFLMRIENIGFGNVRILRVDFNWRGNYLENPETKKFGIKFGFQYYF